jgi:cell surface protein SprA
MYNSQRKKRLSSFMTNMKSKKSISNLMNKLFYTFAALAVIYSTIPSAKAITLPDPYENVVKNMISKISVDTIPMKDRKGDFITDKSKNPFDITPNVLEQKVEYDVETGKYIVYEKIGNEYYRTPTYLTFEEYLAYKSKEQESDYFKNLAGIQAKKKTNSLGSIDPMSKIDISKSLVDRLFGGTEINVKPQGGIDLTLGFFTYYRSTGVFATGGRTSPWNPLDPVDLKPRLTVDGNIGSKMKLNFNYDAQSSFNFDQQIKLKYDSEAFSEDDIVKKIEAGNVSLPLKGTLIKGSQSLMGLKTDLQFGHLRMSLLASQQLSKQNNIKIENGASIQDFDINPDDYDENRHFFLSHYNRAAYEDALGNIPFIRSSFRVAQIQVWISDDRPDYQIGQSNIAAIADLAEGDATKYGNKDLLSKYPPKMPMPLVLQSKSGIPLADNKSNGLYKQLIESDTTSNLEYAASVLKNDFKLKQTVDFETFRGRLLNPSEYTYNAQLGYISLNLRLRPDQRLGVAYKYFYTENCDSIYSVGQLSGQAIEIGSETRSNANNGIPGQGGQLDADTIASDKVIFVKLLKPSNQQVNQPTWQLMMKNVYRLSTTQLNKEGFTFDIFYKDDFADGAPKKFIPELKYRPLLSIFKLDTLNRFGDPQADGVFDYVPGITVNEKTGSIIFPVLEPFGSSLSRLFKTGNPKIDSMLVDKYVYQELYDTSVVIARQTFLSKNKFIMKGKVKTSTTGEINLGPFVPRDGVRVTAGGINLIENVDYEIDYSLGKLRVLNPAYLSQGTPLNVSFEDQSAFSNLNKTMFGARFDYDFSKKFTMGATYLRLKERPFTQKVNIGDDPINNRIVGLDLNYSDKTPWVTTMLDKLPFYSTKAESSFAFSAEAAYLKPGHNSAINSSQKNKDEGGIINIDDFEGALSGFTLGGFNTNSWILSSTPPAFRESELTNDLTYGANRAKLSWYQIDQSVNTSAERNKNNPYSRLLTQTELFNRQVQTGVNQLFTFDVSYYPTLRGPYNFDRPSGITGYTNGTEIKNNQLLLKNPSSRWGGIMRYFQNTDFEANNYQFIEFWVLNPFLDSLSNPVLDQEDGEIVLQLGNVSEDVLRDNLQFYENGLPTKNLSADVRATNWGNVPTKIPLVNGFSLNDIEAQDLGFDGMSDAQERDRYQEYLADYATLLPNLSLDPAGDNFVFYNDKKIANLDMVTRMQNFSGPQGNTPQQSDFSSNNTNIAGDSRFYRGSRTPDSEDLNNNRSLEQGEAFYEYKIKVKNLGGEIDTAASQYFRQYKTAGINGKEKWYRFVVPLNKPTSIVDIQGFRSIQFMRMYFTKFETQKTFRFAEFQLVRNQWRPTLKPCTNDGSIPNFSIDEVGIEENQSRKPNGYIQPQGIQQEFLNSSLGGNLRQDEKSIAFKFCDLQPGCQIGISKIANVELNLYKKLQMFAHLESEIPGDIEDGEMSVFIKLGKDLDLNYYEYEMPIKTSKDDETIPRNDKGLRNSTQVQQNTWPDTNKIDAIFAKFADTKINKIKSSGSITELEDTENTGAIYRIKGTPSLGDVKIIEIGLRNNSKRNKNVCGTAWLNELRAVGLNEKGAWAAQAKAQMKLADFGDLNVAASHSSIGFGSLEQKLLERSREAITQFDASTSLGLGKLLPKFLPISIPFFAQYTKSIKRPQFDPYQEDITTQQLVDATQDKALQDEIRDRAPEKTTIKSYNVTNIRKEGGKGGKPWSLENISGTYSFTETTKSDPIIKEDVAVERKSSLDYGYAGKPKYIQPLKFIKPKALKLLSEFNFNPLPTNFGFNTNLERYEAYRVFRLPVSPVYRFDDRRIKWDRNYTLDWDFSKALRMNFKVNVTSVVDEKRQVGIADDPGSRPWVDEANKEDLDLVPRDGYAINKAKADLYRNQNYKDFGRAKNYQHNFSVNYKLPISLLPLMDWVTSSAEYKSTYSWTAGPLIFIDNQPQANGDQGNRLGNIIQNTQNRSLNAQFSFDKLYSKWGYLRKIETGGPKGKSTKKEDKKAAEKDDLSRSGKGDSRGKEKGELAAEEKEEGKNKEGKDQNGKDSKGESKSKAKKDKTKEKDRVPSMVERVLVRPILSLRSVKFNYKEEFGTIIPGFMPESSLLGLSEGFTSPGWEFAAGLQPDLNRGNSQNYLRKNQTWFNQSSEFNDQISQNQRQNINLKVAIEPFKDFKIDVDFNKDYKQAHTEIFKNKTTANGQLNFMQITAMDMGSFETTYSSLNTLFNNSQDVLAQFKANRGVVARRLAGDLAPEHPDYPNFPKGYGPANYSVVVPSFLAAYTGTDARSINTDITNNVKALNYIPKPNWQLRYDGLSKLSMFKNLLTSFSLKHGYKSTLTVSNFMSGVDYQNDNPFKLDEKNNYYSQIEIPTLMMKEDFSPLIGIDFKTKNNMEIKFEYKKGRALDLRASNNQLSETLNTSLVFGYGYIIDNFKGFGEGKPKKKTSRKKKDEFDLSDKANPDEEEEDKASLPTGADKNAKGKKGKNAKKDKAAASGKGKKLTINCDFSFRDEITQEYFLGDEEQQARPFRGQKTLNLNPTVEYQMYKNLAIRLYFEYQTSTPYTPGSYNSTNMSAGTVVRYMFN